MGFYVGRYSLCDQTLMELSISIFTSKLYVKMIYADPFQILNLFWHFSLTLYTYSLPNLNTSHHKC